MEEVHKMNKIDICLKETKYVKYNEYFFVSELKNIDSIRDDYEIFCKKREEYMTYGTIERIICDISNTLTGRKYYARKFANGGEIRAAINISDFINNPSENKVIKIKSIENMPYFTFCINDEEKFSMNQFDYNSIKYTDTDSITVKDEMNEVFDDETAYYLHIEMPLDFKEYIENAAWTMTL